MNRLETLFGDDGFADERRGALQPFGALYRFAGRTWGITVWARDWWEARAYCKAHRLRLDGLIVKRGEV